MRFTLAPEHVKYFASQRMLEVEGLLSTQQVKVVLNSLEKNLSKRLNPTSSLDKVSNQLRFALGRNLTKEDSSIRNILFSSKINYLASSLFHAKPLRHAYDQLFLSHSDRDLPFSNPATIQEISCISPLIGALFILLKEQAIETTNLNPEAKIPIPQRAGSGIFIAADLLIDLPKIFLSQASLLLIAYSSKKLQYLFEPKDPLTHILKKDGLAFGDIIPDHLAPTLSY